MKNKNVNSIIGAGKEARKKYHDEYYNENYVPKEKVKHVKKYVSSNQKKKVTKHTIQAKLVCITNPDSGEVIRIRKNEIDSEVNKKGWKSWEFVAKEAYKEQQSNRSKRVFRNLFSKIIKINLVKAFYATKTENVAIKDMVKVVPGKETREIIGKPCKRVKYITKDKSVTVPIRKYVKGEIVERVKMKLVKKRIYVPNEDKTKPGKYITKKVLTEIPIKERAPGKFIETTKKKKVKTLVEKVIETIPGKVTTAKVPILVQAYKWVATRSKKDCYIPGTKIPITLYR